MQRATAPASVAQYWVQMLWGREGRDALGDAENFSKKFSTSSMLPYSKRYPN